MKIDEKGFTYIELIVAIAIMALVGIAATAATFQVFQGIDSNNSHMTTVCQVQNAGYWISRDTLMAQSITTDNLTQPDFLILCWTEENSGDEYQIVYTLENMSGGELKKLLRTQSINGGGTITTLVARYINLDSQKTRCEFSNGIFTLTITATVVEGSLTESETRTYQVVPRPG